MQFYTLFATEFPFVAGVTQPQNMSWFARDSETKMFYTHDICIAMGLRCDFSSLRLRSALYTRPRGVSINWHPGVWLTESWLKCSDWILASTWKATNDYHFKSHCSISNNLQLPNVKHIYRIFIHFSPAKSSEGGRSIRILLHESISEHLFYFGLHGEINELDISMQLGRSWWHQHL